jgi:hypothetical protein
VCHEFAGRYTNVHHIVHRNEGGPDTLDNAIVVCLRCHGEAGHYNSKHPIGDKYSKEELRRHRDEWWKWCAEHPEKPLPSDPILISPDIININGINPIQTFFKIYNRSGRPLYGITLKLKTNFNPTDNFTIERTEVMGEMEMKVADLTIDGEFFELIGENEKGTHITYVYLSSINPSQTLTFTLKESMVKGKGEDMVLQVIDYKETPVANQYKDGNPAIPFHVDEQQFYPRAHRIGIKKSKI